MKTTLSRATLTPVVKAAGAFTRARSPLPIFATVKIELGSRGCTLVASNSESWFIATVDADAHPQWAGCVNARQFGAFINSLSAGTTIELTADDGDHRLTLAGARSRARLAVLPSADFPVVVAPPDGSVGVPIAGAGLAMALRFCALAANDGDDGRYHLCGVYLDPEGQVVATDGHRLAVHRLIKTPPAFPGLIVPLPVVKLATSLLEGFAHDIVLRLSPRIVSITAPRWTLTSRVIDGTFVEWRHPLQSRKGTPVIVERKAFAAAVAHVAEICDDPVSKSVRARVHAGELTVSAVRSGIVEASTSLAIEDGPADAEVGVLPRYLADALDALDGSDLVELYIVDRATPVWICSSGDPDNGTLVMPMRV
jgi:DNA polymerase-3 subunit beta